MSRPNIFVYQSDQEIYIPEWMKAIPEIKEYIDAIEGLSYLRDHSIEFKEHRVASLACTPSRASLYSGRFAAKNLDPNTHPFIHTILHTYGVAKSFEDKDLVFFESPEMSKVLTMGVIFQRAGYDTAFFGKDHVFRFDHQDTFVGLDGTEREISTVHPDATRNLEGEALYSSLDVMRKFGWTANKWVGPNPHSGDELKQGEVVDPIYVEQVIEFLSIREQKIKNGEAIKPLLLMLNMLQPHDESFYGIRKLHEDVRPLFVEDHHIPRLHLSSEPWPGDFVNDEDLAPSQLQFLDKWENDTIAPNHQYEEIYGQLEEEREFYFKCYADHYYNLHRLMKFVEESCFYRNTYQIKISDHGTCLRSKRTKKHKGFPQKWLTGWDLAVKGVLFVYHPSFIHRECNHLTSSVDILPTILCLAGITKPCPMIGENLVDYIIQPDLVKKDKISYTSSYDEVLNGERRKMMYAMRRNLDGFFYEGLYENTCFELIVCYVGEDIFKLIRFFDWKCPEKDHFIQMYNLSKDPAESTNLARTMNSLVLNMKSRLDHYKELVFYEQKSDNVGLVSKL